MTNPSERTPVIANMMYLQRFQRVAEFLNGRKSTKDKTKAHAAEYMDKIKRKDVVIAHGDSIFRERSETSKQMKWCIHITNGGMLKARWNCNRVICTVLICESAWEPTAHK
ncbi:hypothetical protein O9992_21735 [Vibrio lentus]|nr:hypothetical protein [Vibrio lentus]